MYACKQAHLEGFIVNWIQSFLLDSCLLFCIFVFVRKKIGLHIPASRVGTSIRLIMSATISCTYIYHLHLPPTLTAVQWQTVTHIIVYNRTLQLYNDSSHYCPPKLGIFSGTNFQYVHNESITVISLTNFSTHNFYFRSLYVLYNWYQSHKV